MLKTWEISTTIFVLLLSLSVFNCFPDQQQHISKVVNCTDGELLENDKIFTCIKKFFRAAYKKEGCTEKYNFFARDQLIKNESFVSGKQCLLDVVKEKCSRQAVKVLTEKYEEVKSLFTAEPGKVEKHQMNLRQLECFPGMETLNQKGRKINLQEVAADDPELKRVLELCQENQECLENTGTFMESQHENAKAACEVFRLVASDFYTCAQKMIKEKPDVSKYKCLDGHEFFDSGPKATCERFMKRKECVRTVVKEFCGEKSLKDYEKNVKVVLAMYECKT